MILTEIPWNKTGPDAYEYTHAGLTYKRKGKEGAYRYSVWEKGVLIDNTLRTHFDVLIWIRDGKPSRHYNGYFGFRG